MSVKTGFIMRSPGQPPDEQVTPLEQDTEPHAIRALRFGAHHHLSISGRPPDEPARSTVLNKESNGVPVVFKTAYHLRRMSGRPPDQHTTSVMSDQQFQQEPSLSRRTLSPDEQHTSVMQTRKLNAEPVITASRGRHLGPSGRPPDGSFWTK